jgi:hypothetical protein
MIHFCLFVIVNCRINKCKTKVFKTMIIWLCKMCMQGLLTNTFPYISCVCVGKLHIFTILWFVNMEPKGRLPTFKKVHYIRCVTGVRTFSYDIRCWAICLKNNLYFLHMYNSNNLVFHILWSPLRYYLEEVHIYIFVFLCFRFNLDCIHPRASRG